MDPVQHSPFRTVFGSQDSKDQFAQFLNTIFYQLDDRKVFEKMEKILADPKKTDEQIYTELVEHIDQMRKPFSMGRQLTALSVLLKGMGAQTAQLLKDLRPDAFHDYAEIYFKRYLKTTQKTAQLPLDGRVFAISDHPPQGSFKERLEADALFSSYPYQEHVPLNDADCQHPEQQADKTYKPLGNEIQDGSLDLVSVLGGFHHAPVKRVGPFVDSLRNKLRPGGVVLLRDHNVTNRALSDMVSVVHSFVNAGNHVPWAIERDEIREFRSLAQWTELMRKHGFVRISDEALILPHDPTQNAMIAFARKPDNLAELRTAASFRKDSARSPDCTRATWIEWGNVRYAKQFAQFIRTKHAYAFDYLGHLKQHWKYFTTYIKESRKDLPLKKIILSDNFSTNLFILTATAFQCIGGYLSSLPSAALARVTKGANWRNATDLTALEKAQAKIEEEYSTFIDHTPNYMFPYTSKIKDLWSAVWNSNESVWTKGISYADALVSTIELLFKAAVSVPMRAMLTQNGQPIEPDKIGILIHDPANQFKEAVYETNDHYKLVLVPRYRVFTELCKELAGNRSVQLVEIGGQEKITVDVLYGKDDQTVAPEGATLLYSMDKLQDDEQRRYATYEVPVHALATFIQAVGASRIEYVHE
jgi:SAM-dependent methyltransferase